METYSYDVYGRLTSAKTWRNGALGAVVDGDFDGDGAIDTGATADGFVDKEYFAHSLIDNPIMFQGQRYDEESGLYYMKNRYYDPETGRFITRDPARDGINLYAFVNDNPINFVDPLGLTPTPAQYEQLKSKLGCIGQYYSNDNVRDKAKGVLYHMERAFALQNDSGHKCGNPNCPERGSWDDACSESYTDLGFLGGIKHFFESNHELYNNAIKYANANASELGRLCDGMTTGGIIPHVVDEPWDAPQTFIDALDQRFGRSLIIVGEMAVPGRDQEMEQYSKDFGGMCVTKLTSLKLLLQTCKDYTSAFGKIQTMEALAHASNNGGVWLRYNNGWGDHFSYSGIMRLSTKEIIELRNCFARDAEIRMWGCHCGEHEKAMGNLAWLLDIKTVTGFTGSMYGYSMSGLINMLLEKLMQGAQWKTPSQIRPERVPVELDH